MKVIKRALRKCPKIDKFAKDIYYLLRKNVEQYFRLHMQEYIWKSKDEKSAADYLGTLEHPHRKLLIDTMSTHMPFNSVLEIGCNSGPNVVLIAEKYLQARVVGIDINERAIDVGRKYVKERNLHNVELYVQKAGEIHSYDKDSFDIVVTDATLMYVGPEEISDVLRHIIHIAKKAVILVEWDFEDQNTKEKSRYHYGHWVHNFSAIATCIDKSVRIKKRRITVKEWEDKNWTTYGTLLEIKKESI